MARIILTLRALAKSCYRGLCESALRGGHGIDLECRFALEERSLIAKQTLNLSLAEVYVIKWKRETQLSRRLQHRRRLYGAKSRR